MNFLKTSNLTEITRLCHRLYSYDNDTDSATNQALLMAALSGKTSVSITGLDEKAIAELEKLGYVVTAPYDTRPDIRHVGWSL